MDSEPDVVDDAVVALLTLGVSSEDEARRMLGMWARRGALSEAQAEDAIRGVLSALKHFPATTHLMGPR